MNLVDFIQKHQEAHTINYIKAGFQKSQFITNMPEIATLMKRILNKLLTESDRQKVYNQLQSGGLPVNLSAQNKTETCKKQSFCTEFSMMISNIIGLLGFEVSKYLMLLFGIKHFIQLILDEINSCTTYEDIGTYVNYVRNMFLLGNSNSTLSNPIGLDETFDMSKYASMLNGNGLNRSSINYFNTNVGVNPEESIFNWILKYIDTHVKNENIISFNDDKHMFYDIIADMLEHLKLGTYEISDINELIINLGRFNVCYDKSFIKMFELLYQEGFSDMPADLKRNYKPHVIYIENDLKLDEKCDKYSLTLNKYFHDIYDNTLKSVIEILPNDYMNVNVHDNVYEMLSDITLNLFVNMCRKIYNNQLIYGFFGKSTRIQFIQVFQAFMDSVPRFYTLTKSQRTIVHYILLSDKILNDSIESVNKLNGVSSDDSDDSDDSDNGNKDETNSDHEDASETPVAKKDTPVAVKKEAPVVKRTAPIKKKEESDSDEPEEPKVPRRRTPVAKKEVPAVTKKDESDSDEPEEPKVPRRRTPVVKKDESDSDEPEEPKVPRRRTPAKK